MQGEGWKEKVERSDAGKGNPEAAKRLIETEGGEVVGWKSPFEGAEKKDG